MLNHLPSKQCLNYVDAGGKTPLHYCSETSFVGGLTLLLDTISGGDGGGDDGGDGDGGVVQRLVIQLALEASTWTVVVKKDEKKKKKEEKEEEEGVLPMNQPLMHLGFDSMRLVLFRDSLIRHLPSVVVPPTLLLQLFGSKGLEAATLSIVIHELTTAVMIARELHALTFKWPCLSRRKEEETDAFEGSSSSELKPRRRGMEASVLLERDSRHNKSQGKDGGLSPKGGLEACLRKKFYEAYYSRF